jgi:hypothetical protein
VAWTPKAKGKKLTTTARWELRLEGPERHIPNKPQIPIPKLALRVDSFLRFGDLEIVWDLGFGI